MTAMHPQPKRHHFIPKVLLRNFADGEQRLWFRRLEFPGNEVRRTHIDNLFVEGQLNTIIELDGTVNRGAEAIFGDLEAAAGEFLPPLVSAVRDGAHPVLSASAWQFWHHLFLAQWSRTPSYLDDLAEKAGLDETLRSTAQELLRKGELSPNLASRLEDPAVFAQQRKNAMIMAHVRNPDEQMMGFLANQGMAIYSIERSAARRFIVGDVSIARPQQGSPMFMPISPDIALGLSGRRRETVVVRLRDRDIIRRMNWSMITQSQVVASGDKGVLERSLAPRR